MSKVYHLHLGRKHPQAAWKEYMSNRQNIPLSLRSSLMTKMVTPWGRYRWTRQPFGISSASKEWQRQIHMVLDGLLGFSIAEGILIPGCGANDVQSTTTVSLSPCLRDLNNVMSSWMSTRRNSLFPKPPPWAMLQPWMASSPTRSQLKLSPSCPLQPKAKQCAAS